MGGRGGFFVAVEAGYVLLLIVLLKTFPLGHMRTSRSKDVVLCAPCAGVSIAPKTSVSCDVSLVGGASEIAGTGLSIDKLPND